MVSCGGVVAGRCVGAYVCVLSQQNNSFWVGDTVQLTIDHSFQTFDLFPAAEDPVAKSLQRHK